MKLPGRRYLGIDGCPGGWFCVEIDTNNRWSAALIASGEVAPVVATAESALIDIPIGLLDSGSEERVCDREARRALGGKRGSSVFPAPVRASLGARDYDEALAIHRRCTGRGISKQSWMITPKIKVIDDLLQFDAGLRGVLRESHPEVCFHALNDATPMRFNKKTAQGLDERMTVLRRFFPNADAVLEDATMNYRRKQVARDDIVDALVLAVSARLGGGCYSTLPANPAHDSVGLAMEIVFCTPQPVRMRCN